MKKTFFKDMGESFLQALIVVIVLLAILTPTAKYYPEWLPIVSLFCFTIVFLSIILVAIYSTYPEEGLRAPVTGGLEKP